MKTIILILLLGTLQHSSIDKSELIGEYQGGMEFTIWANLKLLENNTYEYFVGTHTSIQISDIGTWEMDDSGIILNSDEKVQITHRGKKTGRKRRLFKNYYFEIEKNESEIWLITKGKNKRNFRELYWSVKKKSE